ncbi:MAG: helix-turn-helix transcriptional regulator [Burkholderiaceae bacterium]
MSHSLRHFSLALDELYRMAQTASLDEFAPALIGLLNRHIAFDGAVLGSADPLSYGDFSIAVAHVHNRDASILDDYAALSALDPVTQAFLAGLAEPLAVAVDTHQVYAAPEHGAMAAFTRQHRLRHLLLCGQPPSLVEAGRWVVLYRADDQPFEAATAQWLGAFWAHMDRALTLNRSSALAHASQPAGRKAIALVDHEGRVEAVDALFSAMLHNEFGAALHHRLPDALVHALRQDQAFEGRTVFARFTPLGRYRVCELREAGPLAQLSPRERLVAAKFSAGLSSREIAAQTGVSQYTVQSQLASVYRKLGVSDKAALARLLADSGA